jgi:tight adherence protein B
MINPVIIVITFLVLFAVILIAISIGYRLVEQQRKKHVSGMLDAVSGEPAEKDPTILFDAASRDPLEELLRKANQSATMTRWLQQSGLSWSTTRFAATAAVLGALGAFLGVLLRPLGIVWLSTLVFMGLFALAPYLYVHMKRARRIAELESQLPEALDFLARSMRAGHAFSISLEMLGEESPDPIGQEFRVLFNEQNLGAPLDVALENFALRIPLLDVKMFVSSVLLQRQTGGNLSEILVRLAYVIRERFRLKGQVRAASAHGRITALVLTALPVVLVLALLVIAPGYLQGMAADPDGKWMIIGALAGQGLGYYCMRRITDIKV